MENDLFQRRGVRRCKCQFNQAGAGHDVLAKHLMIAHKRQAGIPEALETIRAGMVQQRMRSRRQFRLGGRAKCMAVPLEPIGRQADSHRSPSAEQLVCRRDFCCRVSDSAAQQTNQRCRGRGLQHHPMLIVIAPGQQGPAD